MGLWIVLVPKGSPQEPQDPEKPQERIKRLEEKIKRIKIKADIIVCPELFLSGYGNNKDIKKYAEKSNGFFETNNNH